ncbi:metal ABC transporter substrate-binding protein [Spirillospora albida]|uniref:metal ABC transporter substrate-binding protein n=1 Tax=Spirillospora albida TaxID=58123 RepID=UPI000AE4EA89|nr:metal ABC transporter substrate-binding protein [Spirillospora albida]
MLTLRTPLRPLSLTAAAVLALGGLAACGDADAGSSGEPEVIASFYPVAWLAERVGGPDATVRTLTKPGAEPHDLELTARQIADVGEADLTFYVKGVQPAVDDAVGKHGKGKALDAATLVKTLPPPAEEEHGQEEEEHGHEEHESSHDPHIWLDPSRMATIATALGDRLASVDAPRAAAYRERAKTLAAQLTALDGRYRDGLKTCKTKSVVTAHAAFGYLTDRYGLRQISIAGVDPANEPSPKRLAELTHEIEEAGATTVFTETLVSPKVAQTLAREAGVKTAVLDPVEGIAAGASGDYLTIMQKNLDTLRPALGCS